MDTFWGQIWIELLGGITGSFIFLLIVLYCMRPSISISSVIAKLENTFDFDAKYTFVFKLINKSWFNAYEIQHELFEVSFYPAIPSGVNKRLTEIPLKRNHIKQICARQIAKGLHLADHCVVFRTNADLQSVLSNESKALLLQVTLRHGLSGLSAIHKMDYRGANCIRLGSFKFGNTFEIN